MSEVEQGAAPGLTGPPVAIDASGAAGLPALLGAIEAALAAGASAIELRVLDPEHGRGCFAGEWVERGDARHRHRPWRLWVELADRLGLRLGTPRPVPGAPLLTVRLERLAGPAQAGQAAEVEVRERYGAAAAFARLDKAEDPGFVLDLAEALARVQPGPGARVLALGCGAGAELALLMQLEAELGRTGSFVGVDHSPSALAAARARFDAAGAEVTARITLIEVDLGDAAALRALGRFDLVLAIAALQGSTVDDRAVLRGIVQDSLSPTGAVILAVPNCRYTDGELRHGARMKNFRQPELGLLFKDVAFYRKYLQQHRRTVYVTGRNYILVTAVPSPSP